MVCVGRQSPKLIIGND
jgi:hypothetical protein